MIPAHLAIARFRRGLTLGAILNVALVSALFICILLGGEGGIIGVAMLVALFVVWVALGYHSVRNQRLTAVSPVLIAAGEFDRAESQIAQSLGTFSLFRSSKLMSLHHLAVLRHAQRRWGDAAQLCLALLGTRLGHMRGLGRQSRLILADCLLEMGDLRGAYQAIAALSTQRLSLQEMLNLLSVQLDYAWRVNGFESMLDGAAARVQLAELMPAPVAARTQALMALAAGRLGRNEWRNWLRGRAELLADPSELIAQRPILAELWRCQ